MTFAITLVLTLAACLALKGAIHKAPVVFYVISIALSVLYLGMGLLDAPYWLWKPMFELIQECMLPLALFVVVMYIGCFSRDSKVSHWLRPIRSELSIMACILTVGHICAYIGLYIAQALSGNAKANVLLAFIVALALLVLLLILGITSFNFVKKRMRAEMWTKVQKWAYVFFGLVYVHLMLMLAPAAYHGGGSAQMSIAVYTIVFGVYAVWRVARWRLDARG